ncbi:protein kinase [Sorangium sp. So ce269]
MFSPTDVLGVASMAGTTGALAHLANETVRLRPDAAAGRAPWAHAPLEPGATIKHYEIIRKLGEGGMGAVFLARDTRLGRLVAIKILRKHDGEGAARFLNEARSTASCEHENIVVIYEVDVLEGSPYMVLEYLEGRTLRSWMTEQEPGGADDAPTRKDTASRIVSPSLAIELMIPVVRALSCAHKLRIVHRDLKPENIFLTDVGKVKVLDFGIAKQMMVKELSTATGSGATLAQGTNLTQKGALLGTIPYISPEQWLEQESDHRVDIWAVGIIFYELCTGAHPLAPLSMVELIRVAALEEPMPSVSAKRPDIGALGAIIDRCLKKRKEERFGSAEDLLAELEPLLARRHATSIGEAEDPFAGLSAFQESDAGRFFGRDRDIAIITGRLRNQPLVVVAGPSGAGKSSLVRAGVIPALKRSGESWESFILRPGRRPLAALADVLAQVSAEAPGGAQQSLPDGRDPDQLAEDLRARPGLLGAWLRARCRAGGGRHRILLFVDQFEELYTLGSDHAERRAFIACLEGAADDASSPLRVMFSIRSDFVDRVADDRAFLAEVTRGLVFLPPMRRERLREALTRPIQAAGYQFESEAMIEGMLGALERTRSPLPLLQFTAAKLWEARDRKRRLLTQDSYDKLGGVAGALSTHADAVRAGLSSHDQRLCREVFLRLVTPEHTRAVVPLDELRALAEDGGVVEQVVRQLADARLLLIERSGEREGTTVELVHESLIERWERLKQWLGESEQDAQFMARLRAVAQRWEKSGEDDRLLWRDQKGHDARAWLEHRRAELGPGADVGLGRRELRYLQAVIDLSMRARRLRRRLATGAFVALTAVALVVSILAVRASQEKERVKYEVARVKAEARQTRNATRMARARELRSDPTTALALLREIEETAEVPKGWADLALTTLRSGTSSVVRPHPDTVVAAAWSPDGRRIVTACYDRTAHVWNADGTGEPALLRGHEGSVTAAAWSPDGRRIVTASSDRTARVWSADGAEELAVLRGHESTVSSAAWSPDGRHIVTASYDRTARVWSADENTERLVLRGHEGEVASAAWSPDGRHIVTASYDQTARVWRADGTAQPLVLRGHDGWVSSAGWSPDGLRVVTASHDRTARVWRADGTAQPLVLRGHEGEVVSAAWSPDGLRVVTASHDRTARVWRADGTAQLLVLRGHESEVVSAAWSPDGRRIVTTSWDKRARVWSTDGAAELSDLRGHEDWVHSAAFSHDGGRVATASWDETARVWSADGMTEVLVLRGHEGRVTAAAWSPDDRRIATASWDKTARVWSAGGGEAAPLVLGGHEGWVSAVAWSPDGRRIATASRDRTARVWSADTAAELLVLRGHEAAVSAVVWSPDGRRIATASKDRTARVWSADTAAELLVLRGHEAAVTSAAWAPDGRQVVTASEDTTARVWSADTAAELLVLRGHEAAVTSAAWSPDGRRVVTASEDKTARLWRADAAAELLVLRGHEGAVSSAAWSPDGRRVVTASEDRTARLWAELTPLRDADDPRLWTAIPYCMSVERRIELLHVSESTARADLEACERRVGEARARAAGPR